jgi:hypothetical protein
MIMLKRYLPWSLRGFNPFLSAYGDPFLFRGIAKTRPIPTNPDADTGLHSAVPHRYLFAYLVAAKTFLRYEQNVAVYVHDDGSLTPEDVALIREHLPGVLVVDRATADRTFEERVSDPLLVKVRRSYTSYLKLFDPTLMSTRKRIFIVDTDTIFLRPPRAVMEWVLRGGAPWYHRVHPGRMHKKSAPSGPPKVDGLHVQASVTRELDDINRELGTAYQYHPGFNSGFIGYERGTVTFDELGRLFSVLHRRFADKIFRWGAEQTVHGMVLCAKGATALPLDEYFVFTQNNLALADAATFIHFIGENRFYAMKYPRLAWKAISELRSTDPGVGG